MVKFSLSLFAIFLLSLVGAGWPKGNHPRNGLIAIPLRDSQGYLQIFTIKPDGTGKKQLTFKGDNGRAAWSPDGKKIIFMSDRNRKPEIWVMDSNGKNQKFLADGLTPDWSHDGKKIAYARPDENGMPHQIWLMKSDGTGQRQITHSSTVKLGPSWSPDEKQMVFILVRNPGSRNDPRPQIGIMNSDGTNERILTTGDRTNVRVNPDGTKTILETAHDANAPVWSPVKNQIAFWSGIETQYGQIWVINSDGTGEKQLTDEPAPISSDDPSWSPDGKQILFATSRSGKAEVWVMNADGTAQRRISDIDASPFSGKSSWQPIP